MGFICSRRVKSICDQNFAWPQPIALSNNFLLYQWLHFLQQKWDLWTSNLILKQDWMESVWYIPSHLHSCENTTWKVNQYLWFINEILYGSYHSLNKELIVNTDSEQEVILLHRREWTVVSITENNTLPNEKTRNNCSHQGNKLFIVSSTQYISHSNNHSQKKKSHVILKS